MKMVKRYRYQLHVMGWDALWIPCAASLGFWVLVLTGGEGIRQPSALTLWCEILAPGLAAFFAAYAAGAVGDPARSLVFTSSTGGWKVYLERYFLMAGIYILGNLALGWLVIATLLTEVSWLLAVQVTLMTLPVLLFFGAGSLLSSEVLGSTAGGAACAAGTWTFFLLARTLAYRPWWRFLYPFLTFYHASSGAWLANRILILGLSIALLAGFILRVKRFPLGGSQ